MGLFTRTAFQCQGLLFCTLLIERSHQRQLTLKAALKYNAVLAPRLTSASRDEPFTWQKIARLEGCPGQVYRVPRQGGLPCLACKRFDEFSKETMKSWLSQGSSVSRGTHPPCKQALRRYFDRLF